MRLPTGVASRHLGPKIAHSDIVHTKEGKCHLGWLRAKTQEWEVGPKIEIGVASCHLGWLRATSSKTQEWEVGPQACVGERRTIADHVFS